MRRNLALFVVSTALTCAVLELVVRLFYPVPPTWVDPQTRHLKSPLLGWVLPPSSESWTIDAPVHVNALGLRDEEIPREKPLGTKRVLCLGDSFTFALGVRLEDLYSKQLERRLEVAAPGHLFEVVNGGVAGYNTRQELIFFLTLGRELDPDLVVLGFYWNDLVGNAEPLPDLATTPRIAEAGPPIATENPHHWIPAPLRNALRKSVLLYLAVTGAKTAVALVSSPTDPYSVVQRALLTGDAGTLAPYWEEAAVRLRQMADAARDRGVPVILLVFPGENEVRRDYPDLVFAQKLREIWASTGFPIIDLLPLYRASLRAGENPFLPYDLHPNAVGMRIAADQLFEVIRAHRYLGVDGAEPLATAARR
jgi:lysophospholipase L1-like esterase